MDNVKLARILGNMEAQLKIMNSNLEAANDRLSSLEETRSRNRGAWGAVVAIAGVCGSCAAAIVNFLWL